MYSETALAWVPDAPVSVTGTAPLMPEEAIHSTSGGGAVSSSTIDGLNCVVAKSAVTAALSGGDETDKDVSAVFTPHPCGRGPLLSEGEADNGPNENPTWEAAGKLGKTCHR